MGTLLSLLVGLDVYTEVPHPSFSPRPCALEWVPLPSPAHQLGLGPIKSMLENFKFTLLNLQGHEAKASGFCTAHPGDALT